MSFRGKNALAFLGWAVVFGLACTQAPLYRSNQNQYFLHGLAQAGLGCLEEDWLANTIDPAPLFSNLVAWSFRLFPREVFYVYFLLMQGLYFCSLLRLFDVLAPDRTGRTARLCFAALLLAAHSMALRRASTYLLDVDYPFYLHEGLAEQHVLGSSLQPSVAGVFLITSVVAVLRNRPLAGTTWACLAGILHGTYLLPAALLVMSYLFLLRVHGQLGGERAAGFIPADSTAAITAGTSPTARLPLLAALLLGGWALLLVLPSVVYNAIVFAPTSAEAFAEAQDLLVHFRMPHHAVVARWFDPVSIFQLAWLGLAMCLVRGSRLFTILAIVTACSVFLTLLQLVSQNNTLALLFPWRISSVLIPIATAVILAKVVLAFGSRTGRYTPRQTLALQTGYMTLLGCLAASGVVLMWLGWAYRPAPDVRPLLDYVKAHKQCSDVYLLPPADKPNAKLEVFRLYTGGAIFVDYKSIPYKDVEVLEWHRRLVKNRQFFTEPDWSRAEWVAELKREGITHIVAPADRTVDSGSLELVYEDRFYRVFRIVPAGGVGPNEL